MADVLLRTLENFAAGKWSPFEYKTEDGKKIILLRDEDNYDYYDKGLIETSFNISQKKVGKNVIYIASNQGKKSKIDDAKKVLNYMLDFFKYHTALLGHRNKNERKTNNPLLISKALGTAATIFALALSPMSNHFAVASSTQTDPQWYKTFSDDAQWPGSDPLQPYRDALLDAGVVQGYTDGSFKPERKITRAELATMLVKEFNITTTSNVEFKDVEKGKWYYPYVERAAAAGLVKGYPDGTFRPNNNVTNAEAITMALRALNKYGSPEKSVSDTFNDVDPGKWYYSIIEGALQEGLFPNDTDALNVIVPNGHLEPNSPATRGKVAVWIWQAYPNKDKDEDDLTYVQEWKVGTNPNNSDTDTDGIEDGTEVNGWDVVSNGKTEHYTSNPLDPDTDTDGVNDGDEYKIKTDPNNPNTYGYPDKIEYDFNDMIEKNGLRENIKNLWTLTNDEETLEEYLGILKGNDPEKIMYLIKHRMGLEDGKLSDEEKIFISKYLSGTVTSEDIDKIVEYYSTVMNDVVPGLGDSEKDTVSAKTVSDVEAIEDVEGLVKRSDGSGERSSEMKHGFKLIEKLGNTRKVNEERMKDFEKRKIDDGAIKIDGKFDDWKKIHPYETIEKTWLDKDYYGFSVPDGAKLNRIYLAYEKDGDVDFFMKTKGKPLNDVRYHLDIFGSKTNDFVNIVFENGEANAAVYRTVFDKDKGIYIERRVKTFNIKYAFGPDGIEVRIPKDIAKELGLNLRVSGYAEKKENEDKIKRYVNMSAVYGRKSVFPGIITTNIPKGNIPLLLLTHLTKDNEFQRQDLIGLAESMTEATIYNIVDDETKSIELNDLDELYKYMVKYNDKVNTLLEALLLTNRQNTKNNEPLFSEDTYQMFHGFDGKLNKYDYAFDFTSPETLKWLGDNIHHLNETGILNWVSRHAQLGMDARPIEMDAYGKEIKAKTYANGSTNAFVQNVQKNGKSPATCVAICMVSYDGLRAKGYIPMRFMVTHPQGYDYSIHRQPGFIRDGKVIMYSDDPMRYPDTAIFAEFPAIDGTPQVVRIPLTMEEKEELFKWNLKESHIEKRVYDIYDNMP